MVSTEAKGYSHLERRVALFERLGGPEVGALARRRFLEGHHDAAILEAWLRLALPVYMRTPRDPDGAKRAIRRDELRDWFSRPGGELWTFDLFPALSRIACPTLVMGGEDDPMVPIECQADIAAALPAHLVRFERFAGCGHGIVHDAPTRDGRDPRLHPPWLRSTAPARVAKLDSAGRPASSSSRSRMRAGAARLVVLPVPSAPCRRHRIVTIAPAATRQGGLRRTVTLIYLIARLCRHRVWRGHDRRLSSGRTNPTQPIAKCSSLAVVDVSFGDISV